MQTGIRQLFLFGVLLAVPLASYFVVFKPQNEKMEAAKKEIEQKKAMLEKLRQATSQTDDLARANEDIGAAIQTIEARLPTSKEMDDILRQVSALAAETGLKVPEFRKQERTAPAGMAMEQPIDVQITGDFDGFYRFLLALEQLPRITRIPDMEITRNEKADGEMEAKIVLSIYYQGDAPEAK